MVFDTSEFKSKIKAWWRGRYIPPHDDPNGPIFLMGSDERPLIVEGLCWLGQFWLIHWQWIIATALDYWNCCGRLKSGQRMETRRRYDF